MSAFIYFVILVVVVTFVVTLSPWDRSQPSMLRVLRRESHRDLSEYYFTLTAEKLGRPNQDAAIGNPLKGLMESPFYTFPPYEADIPLALEFYYIGLDDVMKGNPSSVGDQEAFDWKKIDDALKGSESRKMHAVIRVIIHFPGEALKIPKYLKDAGVDIRWSSQGQSPYYGDAKLVTAMQQFITAFGKRFNGDKRIGYIQAGLLGFWGEWHTHPDPFIPEEVEEKVIAAYVAAFPQTKVQLRYPRKSGYKAGLGLHDDSFAIRTLDGPENGGQFKDYYFWPSVLSAGQSDFWQRGPMGGETGISIQQEVFETTYKAGSFEKQSFMTCVKTCRATYMFHHAAFKDGGFQGPELANARHAHARMGYNYYVPNISVKLSALAGVVDIDVTLTQIGVAPFYYDLLLAIDCSGMNKQSLPVRELHETGASKVFKFVNVPTTRTCLDRMMLKLESSYSYAGRPIKFAQGNGTIAFSVPTPDGRVTPTTPVMAPVKAPLLTPVKVPVSSPVKAPTEPPVTSTDDSTLVTDDNALATDDSATTPDDDDIPDADIKLFLVDTSNDSDIVVLSDEMTLDLSLARAFNVRAESNSIFSIGSVQFYYDGTLLRTENSAPYALGGHDGYEYSDWIPTLGQHTVTAVPFSKDNGLGTSGTGVWISFTVVRGLAGPRPAPAPVAPPIVRPVALPVKLPTGKPAGVPAAIPLALPVSLPRVIPIAQPVPSAVTLAPQKLLTPPVPITAPVKVPTKASTPTKAPILVPVKIPPSAPIKPKASTPTKAPILVPVKRPTSAPIKLTQPPTTAAIPTKPSDQSPIVSTPTKVSTKSPIRAPSSAPTTPAAPAPPVSRGTLCRRQAKSFFGLILCFLLQPK